MFLLNILKFQHFAILASSGIRLYVYNFSIFEIYFVYNISIFEIHFVYNISIFEVNLYIISVSLRYIFI